MYQIKQYKKYLYITALKIHMSSGTYDILKTFDEYYTESRGEINVKVKW